MFPSETRFICFCSCTTPIQDGEKWWKANSCLSPAQWFPVFSNTVENPAYHGKSGSLKLLKSPANALHSPGMGVGGFPLTCALVSFVFFFLVQTGKKMISHKYIPQGNYIIMEIIWMVTLTILLLFLWPDIVLSCEACTSSRRWNLAKH